MTATFPANLVVRPERPDDREAIYNLTKRAFAPMPFSAGNEQDLVDALRAAGALTVSLVAEREGTVVGHIAFSPAITADGSFGWYSLGPISVEPSLQRQGIGKRLITEGVATLRAMGVAGCVLVGDPNYYSRSGFKPFPELAPPEEPAEYFMILPLRVAEPRTAVSFHPVFYGKG